jgi:hypothetical protein
MENSPVETGKKSEGDCGCQCHQSMHSCGHCGFWKGLIAGVVLCALIMFICDRVCARHMACGYYNSPSMTQNAEPDTHMKSK